MGSRLMRAFDDLRFRRLVWSLVGAVGWVGVAGLGWLLFDQTPRQAGFDLALILDAGRRVASGASPYVAGAVSAGTQVESLFYSYPPPVAQAASLIGGIADGVVLLAAAAGAIVGYGLVVRALARGGLDVVDVVLPAMAVAPFVYPFAIALLFGNVDAWFPFAYGALLLAVVGSGRWRVVGGIALGLATLAKLYPGLLVGWLAVRGFRRWLDGGRKELPTEWVTLVAAAVTGSAIVAVSVIVGGLEPWRAYIDVLRAGTGADFVSTLNIGPASQLALLAGDPGLAPRVASVVAVGVLVVTAIAAWWVRSPVASLAIAATLSLVLSPITWFHYPVALLPFSALAWVTVRDLSTGARRTVAGLDVLALVVAGAAIAAPVLVWISVALVLLAVWLGIRSSAGRPAPGVASGGLAERG